MKNSRQFHISPLTLEIHKKIINDLDQYWLSKAEIMKPLHHPLFSLMFRDYSYALYKNEEIASYIYGAGNSNKVFIHVIATKPKFYNQGMAGLLLEKIEKKARLGKKLSIWCYIVPGNILSENFFKSRGFIMRKQIKINSDEIRILYRKKLT